MEEEKKAAKVKCKNVEWERDQLKKEMEGLQATSETQKKELEEVWAGFAIGKKELKAYFQKQVDEMFFYGYRCCMRKNDITQNTPYYPFDDEEEDAIASGLAQGDKNPDAIGPSGGQ